jgi:hypothetical protein
MYQGFGNVGLPEGMKEASNEQSRTTDRRDDGEAPHTHL